MPHGQNTLMAEINLTFYKYFLTFYGNEQCLYGEQKSCYVIVFRVKPRDIMSCQLVIVRLRIAIFCLHRTTSKLFVNLLDQLIIVTGKLFDIQNNCPV